MSDPIVFTITIPVGSITGVEDVQKLSSLALMLGCEPEVIAGGVEYPINQFGVNMMSVDQLKVLVYFFSQGLLTCEGILGPRYIEMTSAEYSSMVPVDFTESTKTAGDDPENLKTEQMLWSEYCPWSTESVDKTKVLVDLSERAFMQSCGDGLSWDEFLVWFTHYPDRILSSGQADVLKASKAYALGNP